jgi:hypothetical protein
MFKTIFTVGVALALGVCSSQAASAPTENGKVLVEGPDSASLRILVRKVDDGPLLWVAKYQLGTSVWVTPGPHKVSVMCVFQGPIAGMNEMLPGSVEINAKLGSTYHLVGSKTFGQNACTVSAKEHT